MRIVRYAKGETVGYGCQREDGTIVAINGDPLTGMPGGMPYSVTRRVISGAQLLAPVVPSSVLCIGLNYRRHAAATPPSPASRYPIIRCCS